MVFVTGSGVVSGVVSGVASGISSAIRSDAQQVVLTAIAREREPGRGTPKRCRIC